MDAFTRHAGTGMPLRRSNVDTDQIIPAVYLKRVTRTGFEDGLFAAWRKDPEFVANKPEFHGATVLVAGPDFGTGSSREHAVWALMDFGFKVVISSRFADIFRGNSGKAGLLAAQVTQDVVEQLWKLIEHDPTTQIVVDLEERTVQADALTRAVPDRRLHALPAAQRPRRHRHHPRQRGRDHVVRGEPSVVEARHALTDPSELSPREGAPPADGSSPRTRVAGSTPATDGCRRAPASAPPPAGVRRCASPRPRPGAPSPSPRRAGWTSTPTSPEPSRNPERFAAATTSSPSRTTCTGPVACANPPSSHSSGLDRGAQRLELVGHEQHDLAAVVARGSSSLEGSASVNACVDGPSTTSSVGRWPGGPELPRHQDVAGELEVANLSRCHPARQRHVDRPGSLGDEDAGVVTETRVHPDGHGRSPQHRLGEPEEVGPPRFDAFPARRVHKR